MQVVVSDASPLHYLILIGEVDLLARFYGEIVVPATVAQELQHGKTPIQVRLWMAEPPTWVEIRAAQSSTLPLSADLDAGEREAIALALELRADLLLVDDRAGAKEAERLGVEFTGTLGILRRAGERGWLDLPRVVDRLRKTTFHARPELFQELLNTVRRLN